VIVDTPAEQMFFVTAFLKCWYPPKDPSTSTQPVVKTATGFICEVVTDRGIYYLLVTNRHVTKDATAVQIQMVRKLDDKTPALGEAVISTYTPWNDDSWFGHPNEDVDVAVFNLSSMLTTMHLNNQDPFYRSIPPSLIATRDFLNELDALEPVVFIGYPNGLFDRANFLPIARRGALATPILVDYCGLPAFLIDASVFPGSSGSPVFIHQAGIVTKRDGTAHVGNRTSLIGVLAQYHISKSDIDVTEQPAAYSVQITDVLDLGIVFRTDAIVETMDICLASFGVRRLEPSELLEPEAASEDRLPEVTSDSDRTSPPDRNESGHDR